MSALFLVLFTFCYFCTMRRQFVLLETALALFVPLACLHHSARTRWDAFSPSVRRHAPSVFCLPHLILDNFSRHIVIKTAQGEFVEIVWLLFTIYALPFTRHGRSAVGGMLTLSVQRRGGGDSYCSYLVGRWVEQAQGCRASGQSGRRGAYHSVSRRAGKARAA